MNIRGIGNNGEWVHYSPIILRKKELKIDTLYFENTEELADSILEQYDKFEEESDDFCGVSVIAHYQIIVDLINYLVKNTSFEIANVQIEEGEMDNYYDEWILNIDSEGKLWSQKALIPKNEYNDGGYVYCEEDAIFVHGDVNSKFVGRNKDQNLIAFEIGEDENSCNGDCEKCDCKTTEFDTDDGYHITVKADLDADEALAAIKEMESRMVHMSEMFDEMMNFSRLLGFRI